MSENLDNLLAQTMETLVDVQEQIKFSLPSASMLLAESFSNGGSLCLAGTQEDAPVLQMIQQQLLRAKRELRPALPAIVAPALAPTNGGNARQDLEASLSELRTLSKANDSILLMLNDSANEAETIDKINQFALHEDISIVTVVCSANLRQLSELASHSSGVSKHVVVPWFVSSIARKPLATLFILNCLSDMIEESLFGAVIDMLDP